MSADAPLLTPGQRRLVGFALGWLALLASIGLFVGICWVLGLLVDRFSGVLWPLAVAGILALILRPVVDLLQDRARMPRFGAIVLIYGAVLLAVGGAGLLIVPPLSRQIVEFFSFLPELWHKVLDYAQTRYPDWIAALRHHLDNPEVRNAAQTLLGQIRELLAKTLPSLQAAGSGVLSVFGFFAGLAIIPIYLFFFLLSRGEPTRGLAGQLTFLNSGVRDDVVFLVREFIGIVVAFFRGQILIGLIMGCLFALGFTLVGLKFGLFVGLALGVLNIIPYLGSIIGLGVAVPLAFFQPGGSWLVVGLVLLVFAAVQCIEGWFLTPKIMGRQTGLHPVVIIVAVFFWGTALGGVLGMVLAVPLTAFFVTAWRLARRKYFSAA